MLFTKFEFGSWWHGLYIIAPIIITLILYFLLRKRSYTTRYIIGVIIGIASLGVLIMRNVDIYMHNGFDPEIIPLQVCHFGNIMVFLALVFKSKTATAVSFSLNMIWAFVSHIEAQSLSHYNDVFSIRAQAYIWGHMLIVIGSLYAVLLKIVRIKWKDFGFGCIVIIALLIPSIIMNSYFNDFRAGEFNHINYFYIYDSEGVPFEFLYGIVDRSKYGWFTIDWVYTAGVFGIGLAIMFFIYSFHHLVYIKDKDFDTHHIFYNLFHKNKNEISFEETKEDIKEVPEKEFINKIVVKNSNAADETYLNTKSNIVIIKKEKKD